MIIILCIVFEFDVIYLRNEVTQQNLKTLKIRAENFQERERRHFKINLLKKKKTLFVSLYYR